MHPNNQFFLVILTNLFLQCRAPEFQRKLSEHTKAINASTSLYIPADKTTNFYKMSTDSYEVLLKKNIEKEYMKAPTNVASEINNQTKSIVENLNLTDRVERVAEKEAFISLKNHKDNFANNPTCRLINPAKSEIGKISKCILDKINKIIINKTGVKQWKCTKDTLNWFSNITEKEQHSFIAFDIVNFYPSISSKLLGDALKFAEDYIDISGDEKETIYHAKQSLLYNNKTAWKKKEFPERI